MDLFKLYGELAIKGTNEAKQELDNVNDKGKKTESGLSSSFAKIGQAVGTYFAIDKIKQFGKACMDAYEVQKQAELKLSTVMKQRMGATDETIQSIKNYASELQKVGVVGDEVQLSGAQQLATFLDTDSALKTLMPAMANLAVQQNGVNVTSENMVSIGNLMGKVMQGQTSALSKVGITFTEAQEKVLKYGNEQERAAMLAEVITDNVGNMNEEFAKTDGGKIAQVKNNMGDLQEEIGAKLVPIIAQLYELVNKGITFYEAHKDTIKPILIFIGTFVGLLVTLNAVLSAYNVITGIATIVTAGAVAPILLVIAAVAALIAIGYLVIKHWDTIKAKAGELKDGVVNKFNEIKDNVTNKINTLKTNIENIFNKIKTAIVTPIEIAKDIVKGIIDKIKGFFNFHVELPKIKLPHFSIKPSGWELGDLLKGKIPKLGIDWYAKAMDKGMILDKPTIFGVNSDGSLRAGGEAGNEVVVGQNSLDRMIQNSVNSSSNSKNVIEKLEEIKELISKLKIYLDDDVLGNFVIDKVEKEVFS